MFSAKLLGVLNAYFPANEVCVSVCACKFQFPAGRIHSCFGLLLIEDLDGLGTCFGYVDSYNNIVLLLKIILHNEL